MIAEELIELINETASLIADYHGMNVPYCESMDMSLFPLVVGLINGDTEEDCLEDLRFLAENNNLIPESLAQASFDEIKDYVIKHEEEIFSEIESDCENYKRLYTE